MALPSLSTAEERKIAKLITGWSAKKFTWDLIVAKVGVELGIETTRQTLTTYETTIRKAYKYKKKQRRGEPSNTVIEITQSDIKMAKRIENLEAEVKQLEQRIDKQQAFIAEIASVAKSNPAVQQVLEKVKNRIAKSVKEKP